MTRRPPTAPMTAEESKWLRLNARALTHDEMCAHLGWLPRLLRKRLQKLGLTWIKGARPWTREEDVTLRSLAVTHNAAGIARAMDRDQITITNHAAKLGISLIRHRRWTDEQDEEFRRLVNEGYTTPHIANVTNEKYSDVFTRLKTLGLKPRLTVRVRADKPNRPKPPRAEKPQPAPRERIGLPIAVRRRAADVFAYVHGQYRDRVAYCERCHAPVVDTPQSWAEHNRRVHITPIRRIA
jgi:hypothetical protein